MFLVTHKVLLVHTKGYLGRSSLLGISSESELLYIPVSITFNSFSRFLHQCFSLTFLPTSMDPLLVAPAPWGMFCAHTGYLSGCLLYPLRSDFLRLDPSPHIHLLTGFQNCVALVFSLPCGIMAFILNHFLVILVQFQEVNLLSLIRNLYHLILKSRPIFQMRTLNLKEADKYV